MEVPIWGLEEEMRKIWGKKKKRSALDNENQDTENCQWRTVASFHCYLLCQEVESGYSSCSLSNSKPVGICIYKKLDHISLKAEEEVGWICGLLSFYFQESGILCWGKI